MHRFMLLLGLGTALLASHACVDRATMPLAAAAAQNEAVAVRRLLGEGHPADESDEYGWTPLMWAARVGAVDAMTALLDAGANPNARDMRNRWTPLLHAIHTQRAASIKLLLTRGADANLAAPGGLTPLLMAADTPESTIVELLLKHGANPRVEGPGGVTPLTQAVSGGALTDLTDRPLLGGCHPATVRALLAHDPDLRLPQTFAGHLALWWARFHDCEEVLDMVGAPHLRPGHQIIAGAGLLREGLGLPKPKDVLGGAPARDDPSRR